MRIVIPTKAIRGMIGTYAVAFELSRQGWLVVPTYGNAPGIDIFASRSDRTIAIQVKTVRTPSVGWLLKTNKIRPDLFYVFVAAGKKKTPRYWVLKGTEVRGFCDNHPTMNAVKIGKADQQHFENRWDILDNGERVRVI
jgi:hypothetical protein